MAVMCSCCSFHWWNFCPRFTWHRGRTPHDGSSTDNWAEEAKCASCSASFVMFANEPPAKIGDFARFVWVRERKLSKNQLKRSKFKTAPRVEYVDTGQTGPDRRDGLGRPPARVAAHRRHVGCSVPSMP